MTHHRLGRLPADAPLHAYEDEAAALLAALRAGDDAAAWCVKWEHPRFKGRDVEDVRAASLAQDDARTVVARVYGFDDWPELVEFVRAVSRDDRIKRFERAVDAVVSGDAEALRTLLDGHPELVHERSERRHRATLLHYVAANGVEGVRQITPPNAVEITAMLLDAGAAPDALADMYDQQCTTLSMLVSSSPPAAAGLQAAIAETLLDRGAQLHGPGSAWQSAVLTALTFGFLETAETLARRAGAIEDIREAAGLGRDEDVARLLPRADGLSRQAALALSAQLGQAPVVARLLDAGEDPDRLNPDGFHAHATPLHHAAGGGHLAVVRLLVERGARVDLRDTIYHATPLGWAEHGGHAAVAEYLRGRGAP
jgi:ankyrin repeat protein